MPDRAGGAASHAPVALPLPLRLWSGTRHLGTFRGQTRAAMALAARLSPDRLYRSTEGVAMRIDPRDVFQVLMLLGFYDREIVGALEEYARPGSVVVDAGAHIGYFSALAARCVGPTGQVHGFECDPRVVPRFREHADANAPGVIHVHDVALADGPGTARFAIPGQFALSSLRVDLHTDARTVEVTTRALDAVFADVGVDAARVSFVKLDVEGAEIAALAGMTDTLQASRAPVLVEVEPRRSRLAGESPDAIFSAFEDLGYRPRRAFAPRGGAASIDDLRQGNTDGAADVLFAPASSA